MSIMEAVDEKLVFLLELMSRDTGHLLKATIIACLLAQA